MRIVGTRHATGTIARFILGFALWLAANLAFAGYGVTFQEPVTPIAQRILDLHNLILLICFVIFVIVFSFMFYAVFAHRKSRGGKPATFHDNTTLEIVWTVIPFLILVGMAIPSTATLIDAYDTSKPDMTVKITAYQWKWRYDYPEQDVSFFSNLATPEEQIENKATKGEHYLLEVDNPVVLPVGKKIRFLVTANDVIHSWWLPSFGIKKDAIPGFINEVWARIDEPGTYRGQCAELCGKGHGYMPIVVKAVAQEEFDKWVVAQQEKATAVEAAAAKTWTKDELMERGRRVYNTSCVACHQAKGEGMPGVFPPLAAGKTFSGPADLMKHLRERGFLSKDNKIVMGPLDKHLDIVMHGIPGTAMQAFAGQLNDVDIGAVVTYERNSFGNETGDVVQPSRVKTLR